MARLYITKDGRRYYLINGTREYIECTNLRRVYRTYETLDMRTGTIRPDPTKPGHFVTERCGVPLFSREDRERGTCSSCAAGWSDPGNMPADE